MGKGPRAPRRPEAVAQDEPTPPVVAAGSLAGLVALGIAASLWALFLWAELVAARSGGAAFCALGEAADCTALWNGAVATALHRTTFLPLAAWGLVWGLVAAALPLLALMRQAEGRPSLVLVTAVRLAAAAGVTAVLGLFGVSLAARTLCLGCFVVYVVVAGYAGIALYGWAGAGWTRWRQAAGVAAVATALAAVAALYPALQTPVDAGAAGRAAVEAAPLGRGTGTGDPDRDRLLQDFVSSLEAGMRQTLADSLHITASATPRTLPAARDRLGPAEAPVRITEWTDVHCDHCASLHETLSTLKERLPPAAFSIDSRQFPLDGACNPLVQRRDPGSLSCLAAKASLCITGDKGWTFAGELFANQKSLTEEKIYALAQPHITRKELDACLASEATAKALEEDIRLAEAFDPDGTPIVAVNGRRGTSFGPYLYAMILTLGEAHHPAFSTLPAPNPDAHLH